MNSLDSCFHILYLLSLTASVGGTVNFTISDDKPDVLVVFGEYDDGSAYVEISLDDGSHIYTGICVQFPSILSAIDPVLMRTSKNIRNV